MGYLLHVRYGSHPEIIGPADDAETLRGHIARPPLLSGYSFYQVAGEKVRIGISPPAARRS